MAEWVDIIPRKIKDEVVIWDNSYIWTSNDDVYGVQNANLGREITKQG